MTTNRWLRIATVAVLTAFVASCGIWEPGEVEDLGEKELEGPGLLTGKRGGLILYQQ